MTQTIHTHRLDNAMVLVAEPMQWLESAAFSLLVPAGCAQDPERLLGLGNFTSEMVQRGCGRRSSRQFVEDLERLGVDASSSVTNAHAAFGGAMPCGSLHEALGIFADVVRRPHVPEEQLEDGRLVCLQEVRAVEDELSQKLMLELRRRRYPDPYGRSATGTAESIQQITLDDVRRHFQTTYVPNGTVLSVAGRFDWPRLREQVERLFGDWPARPLPPLVERPVSERYVHLQHDSSQTHIGLAYPSVPYADRDYYQARGAVGILSDGMSSRLFTEVREKRGLCYSVYASCHSLRDRGSVFCYAGTTTERAQETLDVTLAELERLSQGVEPDELRRLKTRVKSSLILQQESSASRSGAMAADWYYLGRVQTIDEIRRRVDELTCESINAYLAAHPPRDYRIVTLGASALETRLGIS